MDHIKYAISVLKSEVFNLNKELYELQLTKNQEDKLKQDIEKLSKAIQAIKNSFGLDKMSASDIRKKHGVRTITGKSLVDISKEGK